ncbi:MAG TPA: EscU/YscU/HrcU family type III secretion system export apparatus switch protein [Acidisarcina sp.]|nr:EscU/YscU/HrcU family type III secretion system export apparatus switch protein [Acidisarcina sp.]
MSSDRTEQASPRKKQKAREKGDLPRSRELLSGCGMLAGVLLLGSVAPRWVETWTSSYQQFLLLGLKAGWDRDQGVAAVLQLRSVALELLSPLLLLFAAVTSATLVAGIAQGGGLSFHGEALQPKFDRLNPVSNLKNIFSLRATARLGKSLIPALALSVLAYQKIRHQDAMAALSLVRLQTMFGDVYSLLMDAAWIIFAWAAVDFAIEWRSWEQRLKMSKQDMRDEYKESEGNPQIRSRIRGLQRQMRHRKLREDVSNATVVITNPTHFAVALSFDFDTMEAPRVLAKGRDLIAEQMKSEARWAGVPIVENPPLARSLYRSVEPGQPIPFDLYAAVAGILAFLYRQEVEERMKRQRAAEAAAQTKAQRAAPAASPSGSGTRSTDGISTQEKRGTETSSGSATEIDATEIDTAGTHTTGAHATGTDKTGTNDTGTDTETQPDGNQWKRDER